MFVQEIRCFDVKKNINGMYLASALDIHLENALEVMVLKTIMDFSNMRAIHLLYMAMAFILLVLALWSLKIPF